MGESSFWYRPTRVVPDQRPLNGRCCCCCCCKVDPCYLPLTPSIMNVLSLCKCARKILYANINKQQFGHSIIFCVVTVNYWNWDVFKPCLFRVVHFLLHNLPRLEYKGRDEIFAAVLILWMMLYWLLMLMWLKIQIYPTESGNAGYLAPTSTSAVHMSSGNIDICYVVGWLQDITKC